MSERMNDHELQETIVGRIQTAFGGERLSEGEVSDKARWVVNGYPWLRPDSFDDDAEQK